MGLGGRRSFSFTSHKQDVIFFLPSTSAVTLTQQSSSSSADQSPASSDGEGFIFRRRRRGHPSEGEECAYVSLFLPLPIPHFANHFLLQFPFSEEIPLRHSPSLRNPSLLRHPRFPLPLLPLLRQRQSPPPSTRGISIARPLPLAPTAVRASPRSQFHLPNSHSQIPSLQSNFPQLTDSTASSQSLHPCHLSPFWERRVWNSGSEAARKEDHRVEAQG